MEIPRLIACLWNLVLLLEFEWGYSCRAWPFPWRTAIESTSPPQTQWDRIPFEFEFSTSSVTTQKCHGSSYMHSIKLVHNLTISIFFFLRSSSFCLLSGGSALLEKGFRFCMTTERAFAGRPKWNEMLAWGFGNFNSIFSQLKLKLILYTPVEAHVGASKRTSRGCCGRDSSKSTSLR